MENISAKIVVDRKVSLKARLAIIEHGLEKEMSKPHRERKFQLLSFLAQEKAIYAFALKQLEFISEI
jgi:hypothetical protein